MTLATRNDVPSKLPRVAVYLSEELKRDLEMLAERDRRTVSNLVYAWILDNIEQARKDGKLG